MTQYKKLVIDRVRDKKYDQIKIRLNADERDALNVLMRKEGWNNTSGFVKYKLFGFAPDSKLKKAIHTSTYDDLIQNISRRFDQFHKDVVFAVTSYEMNYISLDSAIKSEKTEQMKRKYFLKWCSLLRDYYVRIKDDVSMLLEKYSEILPILSKTVIKQYETLDTSDRAAFVQTVPNEILELYARSGWLMTRSNKDLRSEMFRRLKNKLNYRII